MIISLETKSRTREVSDFINLIDQFPTSTEFFKWLAGDELKFSTHFEQKGDYKFERVGKYFWNDIEVFSGGGEFFLDKMDKSFSAAVGKKKFQYFELLPELKKLNKIKVSSTITDTNYTVVSHFIYLTEVCGFSWEVYELDNLLELLRKNPRPMTLSSPCKLDYSQAFVSQQ